METSKIDHHVFHSLVEPEIKRCAQGREKSRKNENKGELYTKQTNEGLEQI